jgi:hypothetical protein
MITCEQEQNMQYLDEAWGILPKSLSVVDTIGGTKLYSSDAIKSKFLNAIDNQKILRPVADKIENLINRQIIVPAFTNKNLIKLIGHKFLSDQFSKMVLGFYESSKNKIFILLDNNTKFLIFMNNKELSSLTMHELQHYASRNLKSKFFNIHKNTFRTYFQSFYKIYLNIIVPDNIIDGFVQYVLKNFEYPQNQSTQFLVKFGDILFDNLQNRKVSEKDLETQIITMLAVLKMYLSNTNSFISSLQSGQDSPVKLVKSLTTAYKSLGIRNPHSLTIQELIFPSEVVCIESQHKPNSRHYDSIKAL